MKKVFAVLLLWAAVATAFAQKTAAPKLFTPAQMHQDLDSMYAWINATHPNLYLHIRKEKADKAWAKARVQLNRPLTRVEFARIVFPMMAQYRDGHTGLGFDFSDEEFENYYAAGGRFFPATVKVQDGRLFAIKVYGQASIKPGATIERINGRKAGELVREMLPYWPSDNKPNQEANLGRLFSFTLWYLYGWGDTVEVEFKNYGNRQKQVVQLQGLGGEAFFSDIIGFGSRDYKLTVDERRNLAVLELFSFKPKMKELTAFLDSAFAAIKAKNIQHLAIDLRRSGGGYSGVGTRVLQYINQQPYAQVLAREQRRSMALPGKPYNQGFYQRNMAPYDSLYTNDKYKVEVKPYRPEPLPNPDLFYTGKVYLLIGPRTFSSSHMLAAAIKGFDMATVLGEATGNNNQFMGEVIDFQLPNTGWWGGCSTAQYWSAGITDATKYKGVQPDVTVRQSIKDIAEGRDAALEYIRQLTTPNKPTAARQ